MQSSPTFNVSWAGSDNPSGSAVADYTVYVSENGGPYVPWLEDTTLTSAPYPGQPGNTYSFYSVAVDNAGNQQSAPGAVVTTTIQPQGVTATTVSSVKSSTANGTYGVGTNIFIDVTFSGAVTVTGTPQLALTSGGTASYTGGNGTDTLTFLYVVAAGQDSSHLDYMSTRALTAIGGTILDSSNNAVDLTLPPPGAARLAQRQLGYRHRHGRSHGRRLPRAIRLGELQPDRLDAAGSALANHGNPDRLQQAHCQRRHGQPERHRDNRL